MMPLLVDHFPLAASATRNQKAVSGISRPALDLLMRYQYPGNVREFENAIERAVVFCRQPVIDVDDLPYEIRSRGLQVGGEVGERAAAPDLPMARRSKRSSAP